MLLGYNTNGLAHHDLVDAIEILAEIGYRSVAITLDRESLQPEAHDYLARIRHALQQTGMSSLVETGGRYLLDRNHKHEPTLMAAEERERRKRIEFYQRSIDIAAELGAPIVSLWSGILRDDVSESIALSRLANALSDVSNYAAQRNIVIGFEPEPGMFIDTMAKFDQLKQLVEAPNLRLTLDVGHLHCQGETPIENYVRKYAEQIVNVHIEDMRRGVHEHLPFGEGEIDFTPVMQTFREINYQGGMHVELSRHSHDGPAMARKAFEFLIAQAS